ncbi:hypothetical protein ACOKM5_41375 [Streptomyces sp. BH097]
MSDPTSSDDNRLVGAAPLQLDKLFVELKRSAEWGDGRVGRDVARG